MNTKKFVSWMMGILLVAPVFLAFVRILVVIQGISVPGNMSRADSPLYSIMYLTPNFSGYHKRFNFLSGM